MDTEQKIWQKEIQLDDLHHAIITTFAVLAGMLIATEYAMKAMTGFFVVAIQNTAGLNVKGTYFYRIKACITSIGIMTATAWLAGYSISSLEASIIGCIFLCLSMTLWYRLFPTYWASVNIPSAVIYFMTIALKDSGGGWIVFGGAALGTFCQLLGIALLMWAKVPFLQFSENEIEENEKQDFAGTSANEQVAGDVITYGIELLILLSIAVVALVRSGYPHAYWMAFTIAIVLKINHAETKKFTFERIVGTVLGCIIGSLVLLIHTDGFIYILLIGASIFLFTYLVSKHYVVAVIFITIFVLLLIGHQTTQHVHIALERIGFTIFRRYADIYSFSGRIFYQKSMVF